MTSEDHQALYQQYVALAGAMRSLDYQSGYDLSGAALAVLEIANIHLQVSQELARKEREMHKRHKFGLIVLLVLLAATLFGIIVPMAAAQEATSEPPVDATSVLGTPINEATPPPAPTAAPSKPDEGKLTDSVVPVERGAEELLNVVLGLVGGLTTSGFTVFVVSLLKRIRLLDGVSSKALAFVVAGGLVVATWIARYFGVEVQLNSLYETVTVAGPVIMQLVLTLIGSSELYSRAIQKDTAVLSYQRPPGPGDYKLPNYKPLKDFERGQGLVEYALILVLVAVVAIVALALLGPEIGNIFSNLVANL